MANGRKFRYVNTAKWDDEWHRSIGPLGRSLFDWLLTNPMTNLAGIYKASLARIAFDTGIDESELKKLLAKFAADGKVYYEISGGAGWIVMKNWLKNQELNPNQVKSVVAIFNELPPELRERLLEPSESLYIPFESLLKGSVRALQSETKPNQIETVIETQPKARGQKADGAAPGARGGGGFVNLMPGETS